MEPSYFDRFFQFAKGCIQEKFTTAFKGCCLGLIGSLNIFWNGAFASSVVIYILKGFGTIMLTAGTTLTTCYISHKFDQWKEKKSQSQKRTKRKNKAA